MAKPPVDVELLRRLAREELMGDECSLSYFVFADNFSELELLRSTIEDLIRREESSEVDRLAIHAEALPAEAQSEYWSENHPYWWDHIIAPQFRSSFFITVMSALELHLGHLVRDAATVAEAPISADELKGPFYPRMRKFLRLFCDIDAPSEKTWQRIHDYYEVRNSLVHSGGFLHDDTRGRRIRRFAGEVNGLVLNSGLVELQASFCEAARQECADFLFAIWQELVLLCRKHKRA